MRSYLLTAFAVAALIGAPTLAGAASPMPSNMGSMNSSNHMSNMSNTNSTNNANKKSTQNKKHKASNGVQSTNPGAPGYSNSAPLGSAEKKKP
jgi:hypothetical protein